MTNPINNQEQLPVEIHATANKISDSLMQGYRHWNDLIAIDFSRYSQLHTEHLANSRNSILSSAEESLRRSSKKMNLNQISLLS